MNIPILLVAYYFPPEGGGGTFRTLRFARHLPAYGFTPIVLTVHPEQHAPFSVMDPSLMSEVPSDLEVIHARRLPNMDELIALREYLKGLMGRGSTPAKGGRDDSAYEEERAAGASSHPRKGPVGFAGSSETHKPLRGLRGLIRGVPRFSKDLLTNLLSTPDYAISWFPSAVLAGLRAIQKHDIRVIYSTADPWTDHLVGGALQQLTGRPWLADFRDAWTGNFAFSQKIGSPLRVRIEQGLERWVLQNADYVTSVSEPICAELNELGGRDPRTTFTITNAFDPESFASPAPPPQRDRFTIAHVGRLYANRSPRTVCSALRALVEKRPEIRQKIRLRLIGKVEEEHARAAEAEGVKDMLELTGHVRKSEALLHTRKADVLLLLVHDVGEASRGIYTGKLFEYLGAQRTILALAPEGVARELIQSSGVGLAVAPEDVEGTRAALESLYDRWERGGFEALTTSAATIEPFSAPATAKGLAGLLGELVG